MHVCDTVKVFADAAHLGTGLAPVLLDMQYRMHPLIAEYPSALFYKGKLKTGISAEERPLPQGVFSSDSPVHNFALCLRKS